MGLIKDYAQRFVNDPVFVSQYSANKYNINEAVVEVPLRSVEVPAASISPLEVETLIGDLEALYPTRHNAGVAAMVAEAFPAILAAMRWVKSEAKGEYVGQGAVGTQLVATALRPNHIGVTAITNSAATASLGLYAGDSGSSSPSVFSWLPATQWTAGTSKNWFLSQIMAKEAAIVFCGMSEPEEIPKVSGVRFTISGMNTPVLTMNFETAERKSLRDPAIAKLTKPIIFGPNKTVRSDMWPSKTGDSQPTPIAVLITMGQNLTI